MVGGGLWVVLVFVVVVVGGVSWLWFHFWLVSI